MISDTCRWLAVFAVIVLLTGSALTLWMAEEADRDKHDQLLIKTRLAAAGINASDLSVLTGSEADLNSPEYQKLKQQLTDLQYSDPDIRFTYLIGQKPDGTFFFYVDSEPAGSPEYSPPGQLYPEATALLASAYTKGIELTEGPETDRWGTWISGIVPVSMPSGEKPVAVFGMDADAGDWQKHIFLASLPPFTATLLFLSLISGFFFIHQQSDRERRQLGAYTQELEKSEERFRVVFENANDTIILTTLLPDDDIAGQIIAVNRMACRRMNYTREEFLRMSVKDINDQNTWDKLQENRRSLMEKGHATFEGIHVTKSGEKFPVEISAHTIQFQGRDIVIAHVRDITERKTAEEILKKTEKEFRSLISNSADIMAVLDRNGNFLFLSASFYSALGYREEEKSISNVTDLIHPDDTKMTLDKIRKGIEKPGVTSSAELRIRNADGSWGVYEVVGKVSSWGEHKNAVFISGRNITRRKEAEEHIRTLNKQLIAETAALNQMQCKLRILNEQLEEKVKERTYEIEQVNLILTDKNLTLQIMNAVTRSLLAVDNEADFIQEICNELVKTGWCSHVWLAGTDTDNKKGIVATAGDECSEFFRKLAGGYLPPCADPVRGSGGLNVAVSSDPDCAGCPLTRPGTDHTTIVVRLDAGDKNMGILGITLKKRIFAVIQETDRAENIAHDIAFAILYLRTNELEQEACDQITKNLEQLAILNDHIRNPLQGIVGYADMEEGEIFTKIIELSMEINSIVEKLDEGYLESKKIRNFMELHEHNRHRHGRSEDNDKKN